MLDRQVGFVVVCMASAAAMTVVRLFLQPYIGGWSLFVWPPIFWLFVMGWSSWKGFRFGVLASLLTLVPIAYQILDSRVTYRGVVFLILFTMSFAVATAVGAKFYGDALRRKSDRAERELLERNRHEALIEARAAVEERDAFIATVSHELRSPINVIQLSATLLLEGALSERQRQEQALTIRRNVDLMARQISDLLQFSRFNAGKFDLKPVEVDPAVLVKEVIDSLPGLPAKKIDVRFNPQTRDNTVLADPDRLKQVILNLLTNSLKFTPSGGWIEVSIRRAGSMVQIVVKDCGEGIDPEFMPYIFHRYRQAGKGAHNHGGLGLGLSIAKTLVELHGGSIAAESLGKGQGCTITIELPLLEVHNVGTKVVPFKSGIKTHDLTGLKVLLVEDIKDMADLVKELLVKNGAKVTVADNVPDALLELSRGTYNFLISDIGLPNEDGYSLIRKLRQSLRPTRGIPALALTAYGRQEDRRKSEAAGFNKHLTKPVDAEELLAAVAELTGLAKH